MRKHEQTHGLLLITPCLILIFGLTVYPIFYGIWLSFFEKHSFFPRQTFIGGGNYIYLMHDPEFWTSLWLGLVYAFSTTLFQILVGVIGALLLNETFVGRNFVRGTVLFPYMIPTVVAIILWQWLLNDEYGLINSILLSLKIVDRPIIWLGKDNIMLSLVLISVWQYFPFVFLSILARLQTIPPALYDAAKVDGASAWNRFFYITLPQIKNVLFVVVLLRSIWMFTKFDTVWILAQMGGAGRYIRTLPVYAYMRTFTYYEAGMGSALAVIMFLTLVVCTAIYFRMFRREEEL